MAGALIAGVGLGERRVSSDPGCELVTWGLGSCVGLVMWGWRGAVRVMGLSHVVMPDSRGRTQAEPARFADTAVADLANALVAAGCGTSGLQAVICGGAAMFPQVVASDIGSANVARVRQELHRLGIPLRAAEVGGGRGRTVRAQIRDGRVVVSTSGAGEIDLWPAERDTRAGGGGAA